MVNAQKMFLRIWTSKTTKNKIILKIELVPYVLMYLKNIFCSLEILVASIHKNVNILLI